MYSQKEYVALNELSNKGGELPNQREHAKNSRMQAFLNSSTL